MVKVARNRLFVLISAWVLLTGLLVLDAALAQTAAPYTPDPSLVALGKSMWKDQVPCRECHGAMGNGIPDVPQQPVGANFRLTKLSPDEIATTIRCGRPGTEMPHFDTRAYTDKRCYGVAADDLGDKVPPIGQSLSDRQVTALVAFIEATFVGKGDPTFEQCVDFWGPGATTCDRYPHAVK